MEPQVDFFHHVSVSSGMGSGSNTDISVMDENLRLRQENQQLLEQFCQQIYDIQREKETIRLRLIAVESDYDAQMKELQAEITNLREEVQQQKRRNQQSSEDHEATVQALCEKLDAANRTSAETNSQIKEMQQHLQTARTTIQSHVQQIENLRAEINHLREDKATLEEKLKKITDERDCLLTTLSDAQQTSALLQQENVSQQSLINCQENELEQLQKAAAVLRDQLRTLDSAASPSRKVQLAGNVENLGGQSSQPHQSLMGELSAADQDNSNNQWWYRHIQLDPSMAEFYEDDGIEIDDASLLATMTFGGQLDIDGEENEGLEMATDAGIGCASSVVSDAAEKEFLESFRAEVAEIYQQMRQMCVEVSAQSSNSTSMVNNRPGDWTPDQLARIEWDFRLASLRNVISDLRGLLQDLAVISIKVLKH